MEQREIKFRAWDKEEEKMVEIVALEFPVESLEGHHEDIRASYIVKRGNSLARWLVEGGDCILMQYTGLKDKNGKEIYEGDVVKLDAGTDEETDCEVTWMDGGFILVGDGYNAEPLGPQIRSYDGPGAFGEVIGNIYENHELLK